MNQPASALASGNVNGPSWKNLTSSTSPIQVTPHSITAPASAGMTTPSTPRRDIQTQCFVLGSYVYDDQLGFWRSACPTPVPSSAPLRPGTLTPTTTTGLSPT